MGPRVFLISRPSIDLLGIKSYLESVGGLDWLIRSTGEDGEILSEFMGRLCYRSWEPGLNPNVIKVRANSQQYLLNLLQSMHGSVLEHSNYSFVFHNVSRIFTHELVRHGVGTAISQESLRYVRLNKIPFEHPDFITNDSELLSEANDLLFRMEEFQRKVAEKTEIDNMTFHDKKQVTSGARRYAPEGLGTSIGWTANIRALRWVIESRTSKHAEIEIRKVFSEVAKIMLEEVPWLFADFEFVKDEESELGEWKPKYSKV